MHNLKEVDKNRQIYAVMNRAREIILNEPSYKERNMTRRQNKALNSDCENVPKVVSKPPPPKLQVVKASTFDTISQQPTIFDMQNDDDLEEVKQRLCEREDYNLFEVFRMYFDKESKGYINQKDFDKAFEELGVDGTLTIHK